MTSDGLLRVRFHGAVVAEVPVKALADEAPVYEKPTARPGWQDALEAFDPLALPVPADTSEALLSLLASPGIASKEWVYRQYDQQVGINSLVLPGSDAGVLRIKGTRIGVAVTTDCNARFVYLDPRAGAAMAVSGLFWVWTLATLNATVQLLAPPWVRGRAMSLYMLSFTGILPLGALLAGAIGLTIGPAATIAWMSGAGLLIALAATRLRLPSLAEVAEIEFTAFVGQKQSERVPGRLVVRRIPDFNADNKAAAGQGTLFDVWRFHAFFTTAPADTMDTVAADKTHRGHAIVERVHADLKNSALAHLPSGKFTANAAWLVLAVIAFNLTRTAATISGAELAKATTATIRRKLISIPARVASSARRITLHLPTSWPWETAWTQLFSQGCGPPTPATA